MARAETINFYIQISKSFTTEALKELQSDIKSVLDSVSDQIDFLYLEPLKVRRSVGFNFLMLKEAISLEISKCFFINTDPHLPKTQIVISKLAPNLTQTLTQTHILTL